MIGPIPKPQGVYNSRKNKITTIEGKTKIQLLVVICGSIYFINMN
jgi:hypothetical protein